MTDYKAFPKAIRIKGVLLVQKQANLSTQQLRGSRDGCVGGEAKYVTQVAHEHRGERAIFKVNWSSITH